MAEMTGVQQDAFARMGQILDQYGLGSLTNLIRDSIIQGRSETEVLQLIRESPEFKTRFKAIEQRRQKGLPALSPAEVLAYEDTARSMMRSAGLPPGFYDSPDDFTDLLVKDVSAVELKTRIDDAYVRVAQAPASIRTWFMDNFGAQGDAALASYVLDSERSVPLLMKQVAKAEIGGVGQDYGFKVNMDVASRIADAGVSADRARQGFGQLQQLEPLFTETISEQDDLDALTTGAEAVFDLGGQGTKQLEKRRSERVAAASGTGGAASTQRGYTGLGTASS